MNLIRSPGIDSQPGGIDSSESIPGLHKRLQIRAQYCSGERREMRLLCRRGKDTPGVICREIHYITVHKREINPILRRARDTHRGDIQSRQAADTLKTAEESI